jgi:serine/threonine protein kinase
MGAILYQVIENKEPFGCTNDDLIGKARGQTEQEITELLNKIYQLKLFEAEKNPDLSDLLKKLLRSNHKDRLRFSSTIIHPFIKSFPTLPHVNVHRCRSSQSLYFLALRQKHTRINFSKSSQRKIGNDLSIHPGIRGP